MNSSASQFPVSYGKPEYNTTEDSEIIGGK
jgi:hypothetical protein